MKLRIPTISNRILLPEQQEFLEEMLRAVDDAKFGKVKTGLVPFVLDLLQVSLDGNAHPFETLRGINGLQWQDLLYNPYTPSAINLALADIEGLFPQLVASLRQPRVLRRLRVEWLYELTVGRFEQTVPYLHREEQQLEHWREESKDWKDFRQHPIAFCQEEARRRVDGFSQRWPAASEHARKLFRISFMAACRKLFVHLSKSREIWVGSYTVEGFRVQASLLRNLEALTSQSEQSGGQDLQDRIWLKFGLVDHVCYLKPTLDQVNLFMELVRNLDLMGKLQQKLCPFVNHLAEGLNINFLADVFYHIYQPGRVRELFGEPGLNKPPADFLGATGLTEQLFVQLGFNSRIGPDEMAFFEGMVAARPSLQAFLQDPATDQGLIRQRLYKGLLEKIVGLVLEQTVFSLCQRWNPDVGIEAGSMERLMDHIRRKTDEKYGKVDTQELKDRTRSLERVRTRFALEQLLSFLAANTYEWQERKAKDSFLVDKTRAYFITVLHQARVELETIEERHQRLRHTQLVANVLVGD